MTLDGKNQPTPMSKRFALSWLAVALVFAIGSVIAFRSRVPAVGFPLLSAAVILLLMYVGRRFSGRA